MKNRDAVKYLALKAFGGGAMNFLTLRKEQELEQAKALLDSPLKPVKDAQGNITWAEEVKDSGGQIMTVKDVAALLQTTEAAVRQMTKTRAQVGPHPIPFYKVNGKMLRFDRVKVMRWLETTPQHVRIKTKKRSK